MAFFGKSAQLKKEVRLLLSAAKKVENYRGDLFSDEDWKLLRSGLSSLKSAGTEIELQNACEKFRRTLEKLGGTVFPQKMIPEWVELIVVAAILAGGIRGFFFQLFKIPTNSMYPTYNGITSEVYFDEINEIEKWSDRIFRSASFHEVKAPVSGEVSVCIGRVGRESSKDFFRVYIGDVPVEIECPREFSMDSVFLERFFPEYAEDKSISSRERWSKALYESGKFRRLFKDRQGNTCVKTGVFVSAGEKFLKFKTFGGDMVVVNRFIYNFKKPEIGEPFIFRTKNISGLNNVELYYIKRLAGEPGDILQVKDRKLYRNGKIIEGAEAFDKNNNWIFSEEYYGYLPACGGNKIYGCPLENPFMVPGEFYYALGDNSGNSYDSRGWGCVPAEDVVGRASLILYPFSKRFGFAK